MEKVVLLARVSTDKQEYRRQINELKGFCEKMNWEIVGTFANKVSGAETIENRTEIVEMMEFVRKNEVKRVVCLEISRLGRNTLEALEIVQPRSDCIQIIVYLYCFWLFTPNSLSITIPLGRMHSFTRTEARSYTILC